MPLFRILLAILWLAIALYTASVTINHGPNLLPVFFGDIAAMAWPGQFNLDFSCMLILSGTWVAWRHQFSGAGIALGVAASLLGAFFLTAYLLVVSFQTKGDTKAMLLGSARV